MVQRQRPTYIQVQPFQNSINQYVAGTSPSNELVIQGNTHWVREPAAVRSSTAVAAQVVHPCLVAFSVAFTCRRAQGVPAIGWVAPAPQAHLWKPTLYPACPAKDSTASETTQTKQFDTATHAATPCATRTTDHRASALAQQQQRLSCRCVSS